MSEDKDVKAPEIQDTVESSEKAPVEAAYAVKPKKGKKIFRVVLVLALIVLTCVVIHLADLLLRPKYMGDVTEGALTAEYY